MKNRFNPLLQFVVALSAFTAPIHAGVLYWDGADTGANAQGGAGTWDTTTSNWDTLATAGANATWPTSGTDNDATFGGTAGTVTIATGGVTANDITFGVTGYTIGGAGLTLNGTLPVLTVTGTTATINSAITTSVAGGFSKAGIGTLVLGGSNTFAAATTMVFGGSTTTAVNAGIISLTNANALSGITTITSAGAGVTVAQFQLSGGIVVMGTSVNMAGRSNQQTTGAVLVNNSGNNEWGGNFTITNTGGAYGIRSDSGTLTVSGGLRSNTATRAWDVGGAGDVVISGVIGGTTGSSASSTLSFNKYGAGTVTISNSGNTFAGTTRSGAGTILLTNASALVNSTVDMNTADTGAISFGPSLTAATFGALTGSRNLSLLNTNGTPAAVTLSVGNATTTSYSYTGVLSGAGNLYKIGSGTGTFTLDPGTGVSVSINSLSANAGGAMILKSGNIGTTGIDPGQSAYTMGAGARGGTLTVDGAALTVGGSRRFTIGAATNGTANLISGSITADAVVIGHNGTSTMTQSGGTLTTNNLTHQDAGAGTYTLTGGTLITKAINNNTANQTGGQSFTLNLNGGTLQAGSGTTNLITTNGTSGTPISVLLGTGNTQIDTSVSSATIPRPLGDMSGQAGTFTKIGANTLTLTGANNYSGATTVNAGTLSVNASGLGSRGAITSGNTATFSPVTVTPSGAGVTSATLELNGATVNAVATLNGTGTGGNAASLINSNTGTSAVLDTGVLGMTFTSTGTTWNLASQTTSPLSISGGGATTNATANVNLATTTGTFTASSGTGWVTGNTLTVSGGGSTVQAVYTVTASGGAITSLTQTQAGIGYTTFTGLTYTGAKGSAGPAFAGLGGTFAGVDGTFTLSSIALATNGSGYTGSGTITSSDGGGTFTGSTLATRPSLTLVGTQNQIGGAGNLTINTVIGGSGGGFSKIGAGTVTLSGTNTYIGGTTVSAGTLQAGVVSSAGTNGAFGLNSAVTLENTAGATLDLNGFSNQVGSLAGGGTTGGNITLGSATLTTGANNTNTSYAGVISGTGGAVTKIGTGTQTLTGANSYTGATQVNAGTLLIGTAGSLANTAVTVGGATATGTPTLAGDGTIGGATVIAAANGGVVGIHSPGVAGVLDGVGTQTFSSTLNYGNSSIFEWSLSTPNTGNTRTDTYDQVVATGAVTGGAAIFKVILTGNGSSYTDVFWSTSKSWTNIFTGTGAPTDLASVFSSFSGAGLASSGLVTDNLGAPIGQFSFNGSSTLSWTPVPEPTTALAGLLLSAGLLRRRRH